LCTEEIKNAFQEHEYTGEKKMKRWQVEQILYLNSGKGRLVFSESHKCAGEVLSSDMLKKENLFVASMRKVCNFLINVL
jgi:hypothetical protein